ncbi:RNA polymerase Rpb4 family protein [Cryptosporidium meleagridis]|uniref:DNA-directed RNA polymerase III subunit RPC9 n=1 Tax=Cryptosporidium meleagridis TaxID=93969 RepID=A0A2P4YY02_9CRYT|nr:RNA polymerase Rpb4 family protein [Cryptosporidium meleagridis]
MKPKLSTWVPLSSSEVYETISKTDYDEIDKEFETPSLVFFKKSLKWYLESFHSVHLIPQKEFFSLAEALYSKYDLSQQEVMQIIDIRPKKQVELHCIIPDCEKRFSEEDIFQILKLVGKIPINQEEKKCPEEKLQ